MEILSGLVGWLIPVGIILLIVRAANRKPPGHGPDAKVARSLTVKDLVLALLIISAGFTGLVATYNMPESLFKQTESAAFALRLLLSVVILGFGLALKHLTGNFLMVVGAILLALTAPFVLTTLGSAGAFAIALIAFVILVGITVKMSQKGHASE